MKALIYAACGFGLSYFLGAIPFAYVFAKAKGVDIRTVGSGNVGATNVFRCVSRMLGLLCFVADAAKGFIPAYWFPTLGTRLGNPLPLDTARMICAAGAIVGHNWPVYLGFRGGKGVATSTGALLALAWQPVAMGLIVWLVVFAIGRYVSLASLAAAATVAVSVWIPPIRPREGLVVPATFTILSLLVIARHASNIGRLLNGTEHRFTLGRKRQPTRDT